MKALSNKTKILVEQGITLQQVEDYMFEGRIGFDVVEEYVELWNQLPGRFNRAEFDRRNWRSGIRTVLK